MGCKIYDYSLDLKKDFIHMSFKIIYYDMQFKLNYVKGMTENEVKKFI